MLGLVSEFQNNFDDLAPSGAWEKRLITRIGSSFRNLTLLAPRHALVPTTFHNVSCNPDQNEDLLREAQALRGAIYLEDGAISPGHLNEGRHEVDADRHSWHLLVSDDCGRVCGCVRYRQHALDIDISQIGIFESSLASCPVWGERLRAAVQEELSLAMALQIPFIEMGGWAIDESIRGTTEALRMVLAVYAFAREFGGGVGLATATVRHGSSSILRRIGGRSLKHDGFEMPPYEDPQYNCKMEVLRFYSWAPNTRYDVWIGQIASEIRSIPVLTHDDSHWMHWADRPRISALSAMARA